MLTRREICKAGVAVLAFPAALWAMLRRKKPVYHTITKLILDEPLGTKGVVELYSGGELVDEGWFHILEDEHGRVSLNSRPIVIKCPWSVGLRNLSDNRAPGPTVSIEWTDEHGVHHPTDEDAAMTELYDQHVRHPIGEDDCRVDAPKRHRLLAGDIVGSIGCV